MALTALVLGAIVAALVLRPLARKGTVPVAFTDERADLEAAKESKYREIKDAELDYRMGKTSEEDWRALDAELRGQAIEILKRLDKLDGR